MTLSGQKHLILVNREYRYSSACLLSIIIVRICLCHTWTINFVNGCNNQGNCLIYKSSDTAFLMDSYIFMLMPSKLNELLSKLSLHEMIETFSLVSYGISWIFKPSKHNHSLVNYMIAFHFRTAAWVKSMFPFKQSFDKNRGETYRFWAQQLMVGNYYTLMEME